MVYRLRELARKPHDLSLQALCLLLAAITVSVGVLPFAYSLERITGIAQIGGYEILLRTDTPRLSHG